ncbi:hypothetical protein CUMW_202240 [Citrus unshiu]|nr:hypothetical protein CUMW_202240 [Citrus unshiu]
MTASLTPCSRARVTGTPPGITKTTVKHESTAAASSNSKLNKFDGRSVFALTTTGTKATSHLFTSIRKRSASRIGMAAEAIASSDVVSGDMIFEPVLEEGVSGSIVRRVIVKQRTRFPAGTSLYGTGEVSGQLERTGKRIFTRNMDLSGYGTGTTSLCQSHPWVLAVLPSGEALGIDLRKESTIQFIAPSSYPVITFGPFTSPTAVLVSLSHAVGNLPDQAFSS